MIRGTILRRNAGTTRFARVHGYDRLRDAYWVADCDAAGFLLGSKGRWLLASTISARWTVTYTPDEDRQQILREMAQDGQRSGLHDIHLEGAPHR